jgi:hypothetical protein
MAREANDDNVINGNMHTTLHHPSKDCKPCKQSAAQNKRSITSKKQMATQKTSKGQANTPQGAAHPGATAPKHRPARLSVAKHTTADAKHGNSNRRRGPTRPTYEVATRAQKAAREETTRTDKKKAAQPQTSGSVCVCVRSRVHEQALDGL